MALFSRGDRGGTAADTRPREYVLTREALVTADSRVVHVDAVVRFEPSPSRDDRMALGWDADGERAIHAVVVTTLRLTAESVARDAMVGERSRLVVPLGHALELAPVASGYAAQVVSLEVRDPAPDQRPPARGGYDVRVVA